MARKKKNRKQKNRSYFMRYQPKLRRRQECKTDYATRKILILQDKNKYNTPKYRFVVRITNKDVICQVICAKMIGDEVKCAAYSHELPRYGLEVGLTNWSACYATGLLCSRRLLKNLKLDSHYEGINMPNGEHFLNENDYEDENKPNPFIAYLDVGLRPTTTGARIFAAMKGAVDGGIYIPHNKNGKQFPGWSKKEDGENFDTGKCAQYIFGGHVADYMKKMEIESPEKYQRHFSRYLKKRVNADGLKSMYEGVHIAIRENPKILPKKQRNKEQVSKYVKREKKTYVEKRDHVLNKILNKKCLKTNTD